MTLRRPFTPGGSIPCPRCSFCCVFAAAARKMAVQMAKAEIDEGLRERMVAEAAALPSFLPMAPIE